MEKSRGYAVVDCRMAQATFGCVGWNRAAKAPRVFVPEVPIARMRYSGSGPVIWVWCCDKAGGARVAIFVTEATEDVEKQGERVI